MDIRRIMLGLAAWFLGIIVPVLHHAILVAAALRRERVSTGIITEYFERLPWIDYVYLLAMAVVGAILIITGMKKPSQ
jgi:hypothetical protein